MARADFNLLATLDVLLDEGSVAGAARRLGLSPSAMSRALSRLRETTGDPLLVRAGRGLVPTPRAVELRERVPQLVQEAQAILRPAEGPDLSTLRRTFTLRTSEGFVENFGPALIARVGAEAPGVRLRFVPKPDKGAASLRGGTVDLETGVIEPTTGPELRAQALFRDRLVGVVRAGHPLARTTVTRSRYIAGRHISVSREGVRQWPIDDALDALGLERDVVTVVGGFATAVGLARASDLIATVPDRHTADLRDHMHSSRCRSRPRSSPCPCSGTPASTPIRRIAGCAAACEASARPGRMVTLDLGKGVWAAAKNHLRCVRCPVNRRCCRR